MTGLIPITPGQLAGEPAQTVNARELHEFLEVETRFDDWIRRRVEEYGFAENQDYVWFSSKMRKTPEGGRPAKDYHLSIDMAKELAMVEKTDKGRQSRRYFIDCERRAKAAVVNFSAPSVRPLTPSARLGHGWSPNLTRRPAALIRSQAGTKERAFCICRPCTSLRGGAMNWRYDVRVSARPRLLVRQGSVMPPFLLPQSQPYGGAP
jgi:phage anti-repressor protein